MSAVTRQARANVRTARLQTALVVVTVLAASALLAVAFASFGSAGGAYDRLHDRVEGAHLWVEVDPARVDTDAVPAVLADLPGVIAATEGRPTVASRLRLGDEQQWLQMRDWPGEDVPVARTRIVAGRAPAAGEHAMLALDRNLAAHHDIEVGDRVEVLTPGGWTGVEVVGLTVSADMCPAPMCTPVVSHLGGGGLEALGLWPGTQPGAETLAVGLRLVDPAGHDEVVRAAEASLPAGAVVYAMDSEWLADTADRMQRLQSVFLAAFGVVAAVAAGFLIANAIGQTVRGQTRQIGLLKAVGFTRPQLAGTYLAQYLGLALAASIAGVAVGVGLSAWTLAGVVVRFGETAGSLPWWVIGVVPALVVTIAGLFTLLPVRRAARVDVVTAVRTGAAGSRRHPARLARVPAPISTALVDLRSHPTRTLLTAGGLALAALTLGFASVVVTTLDRLADDPEGGLVAAADLTVERPGILADTDVRPLLAAQPDIVAVRTQRWQSWTFAGEAATQGAFAIAGDVDAFAEPLLDGRAPRHAGEAMVGYGLADDHDLAVGDTLPVAVTGHTLDLEITGVYRQLHLGLVLHADTLATVDPHAQPDEYHLLLADGADPDAVAAALAGASGGLLHAERATSFMAPILDTLPGIMLALVVVLAGIALLGVLNTVWMGVQERTRELGLLKAIGMSSGQVVGSVLVAAAAMAAAGYAAGLPAGVAFTSVLLDGLGRSLGFGPIPSHAAAAPLILILPVLVGVAVLGALLPARRAARLPVADALRAE